MTREEFEGKNRSKAIDGTKKLNHDDRDFPALRR